MGGNGVHSATSGRGGQLRAWGGGEAAGGQAGGVPGRRGWAGWRVQRPRREVGLLILLPSYLSSGPAATQAAPGEAWPPGQAQKLGGLWCGPEARPGLLG